MIDPAPLLSAIAGTLAVLDESDLKSGCSSWHMNVTAMDYLRVLMPGVMAFALSFAKRWGVLIAAPLTAIYFWLYCGPFTLEYMRRPMTLQDGFPYHAYLVVALPFIAAIQGFITGVLLRRRRARALNEAPAQEMKLNIRS